MKTKTIRVISILLFIIVLGFYGGYFFLGQQMKPMNKDSDVLVPLEIPNNAGTNQISQLLYDNNLISNTLVFRFYIKYEGLDRNLKAGKYQLSQAMSLKEIVEQLQKGQTSLITFTIPEGFTLEQIATTLEGSSLIDAEIFFDVAENADFNFPWIEDLPAGRLRLEGFLFPDTYKIPENFSEKNIIQMMLNRFTEVFSEDYLQRMTEIDMNIVEVVTLASIIEREIRHTNEQPIASAVFHNRLQKNMRLESCATVQYALGEVKKVLLYSDLEVDSPYNTYKIFGLPPGPIAAPGKGAIEAALYPSDDDYLYFLVKPDGSHHFSRTFAEHVQAKNIYIR